MKYLKKNAHTKNQQKKQQQKKQKKKTKQTKKQQQQKTKNISYFEKRQNDKTNYVTPSCFCGW
jgi:hypothetical protein